MSILKKHYKWLILISLTALLIYLVKPADLHELADSLHHVKRTDILILLALQVLSQLLVYYQWHHICRQSGLSIRFRTLVYINLYGTVIEAVTPGAKIGGEVFRVWQLKKVGRSNTQQATSIVLMQKTFSMSAFLIASLVSLVFFVLAFPYIIPTGMQIILLTTLLSLLLILLLLLFKKPVNKQVTVRLDSDCKNNQTRFKVDDDRIIKTSLLFTRFDKVKKWLTQIPEQIHTLNSKPRVLISQLLLSILIWMLYPVKLIFIVYRLHQTIQVNQVFMMAAFTFIAYLAAMLPLLPGGIGSFEAAMIPLLVMIGFSTNDGTVITVLFRFATFWFVMMTGLLVVLITHISQPIMNKVSKIGGYIK